MGKLLQFQSAGRVIGHSTFGFGFKRDPGRHGQNGFYPGFHQHPMAKLTAGGLPSMTTNVRFAPPVWDQGQTGSCTGHGKAGMDTITLAAHGKPLPAAEQPAFEYRLGRAVDRTDWNIPLQDGGAYPNSLVRASSVWGVVIETEGAGGRTANSPDYATFLEAHVNDEPKAEEMIAASRRVITGYNAIADNDTNKWQQFKQAFAGGHAVGVAVDAGNADFQNYNENAGPLGFTGNEPDHWIFLIDYAAVGALRAAGLYPATWPALPDATELVLGQNSWGKGLWTASGRFWATRDFVERGCFNSLVANLGF